MPHLYNNIPALLKQRQNWVAWGIRDHAGGRSFFAYKSQIGNL